MAITGKITEISRAMQTAEGLLRGIAADSEINEAEIKHLEEWLSRHKSLQDIVPFSEIYAYLKEVHKDGEIESEVHDELLDFCLTFESENGPIDQLTKDIRVLHGFLQGIASDGEINKQELLNLQSWLDVHAFDLSRWPFKDVSILLKDILADGKVSKAEQKEMLDFCRDFSQSYVVGVDKDESILPDTPYLNSDAPVVETIHSIVDNEHDIVIIDKTFCFTGQMKNGKRKDIQDELLSVGGASVSSINLKLDYLVIGANSNPCWVYSTYGRKIEKVKSNVEKGARTIILHEDRFISSMRA